VLGGVGERVVGAATRARYPFLADRR
jgi:hypothetical protein